MSTKLKVTIIASSLAILLFTVVGGFVNVRASSNDGAYRQLSVYSEVLSRIRLEYVEEPNIAGVTDGALHGLLESLDANSSYLSAEEYKRYKTTKNGGKADIGATVSKRFGYAAVVAVIPGGPARIPAGRRVVVRTRPPVLRDRAPVRPTVCPAGVVRDMPAACRGFASWGTVARGPGLDCGAPRPSASRRRRVASRLRHSRRVRAPARHRSSTRRVQTRPGPRPSRAYRR